MKKKEKDWDGNLIPYNEPINPVLGVNVTRNSLYLKKNEGDRGIPIHSTTWQDGGIKSRHR